MNLQLTGAATSNHPGSVPGLPGNGLQQDRQDHLPSPDFSCGHRHRGRLQLQRPPNPRLAATDSRFNPGAKKSDHARLYQCLNEAATMDRALEFTVAGENGKSQPARHEFHCLNGVPLYKNSEDVRAIALENWKPGNALTLHFQRVTGILIIHR